VVADSPRDGALPVTGIAGAAVSQPPLASNANPIESRQNKPGVRWSRVIAGTTFAKVRRSPVAPGRRVARKRPRAVALPRAVLQPNVVTDAFTDGAL
jgi:hypothetical protein